MWQHRSIELHESEHAHEGPPFVVGLGNPSAGDDSAGIKIVERLGTTGLCGCRFVVELQPQIEVLESAGDAPWALFVDAVISGAAAGTVHLVPVPAPGVELLSAMEVSSHGFGLHHMIELSRGLGRRLPPILLLGIEAGRIQFDAPRTEAVQQAIEAVVAGFPALVEMANDPSSPLWRKAHCWSPGGKPFPELAADEAAAETAPRALVGA